MEDLLKAVEELFASSEARVIIAQKVLLLATLGLQQPQEQQNVNFTRTGAGRQVRAQRSQRLDEEEAAQGASPGACTE